MPDEQPFGFMLRKPGSRIENDYCGYDTPVYRAPGFDEPVPEWQTDAGTDPRQSPESEWALALPHHCGDWEIWDGSREDVLAAALRFRAELDAAIAVLEGPFGELLERTRTADKEALPRIGADVFLAHQEGRLTTAQFRDLDKAWNERASAISKEAEDE